MDKTYTREVTNRFLESSDMIMSEKKLTQSGFAKSVHLSASNLARMKTSPENRVSLESLCEMIHQYGISPVWLMTGLGDKYANPGKLAAKGILKARVVDMELAIADIKKSLKILKASTR